MVQFLSASHTPPQNAPHGVEGVLPRSPSDRVTVSGRFSGSTVTRTPRHLGSMIPRRVTIASVLGMTAVLGLNPLMAVDQPLISCDFSKFNKANALPPYLELESRQPHENPPVTDIAFLPDPDAAGNLVARMTLLPGQDRQEFYFTRPGGTSGSLKYGPKGPNEPNEELWVGFRMRVKQLLNPALSGGNACLFQLGPVTNDASGEGKGLFQILLSRSRGNLALRTFSSSDPVLGTRIPEDSPYPDLMDLVANPEQRWVAFTCQLRLRTTTAGFLRMWADGNLVADLHGANALMNDEIRVKWGTYIGGGNSYQDTLSVDYDDIVIHEKVTGTDDGFRTTSVPIPTPYTPSIAFQRTLVPPAGLVTTGLTLATSPLPAGITLNRATRTLAGTLGSSAHGQRIAWWLADASGVRRYQQVLQLKDTTAVAPVPSLPVPGLPSVDSTTSATPTLSGTTSVFATVRIYDGTTLIGNVLSGKTGKWSWTARPALLQGNHDLRITVTDDANTTSPLSPPVAIVVPDTTPPRRPMAPITSSKTSATPVLSGITEANALITIYDNTSTVLNTTSLRANANGAWSWTVTPALPVGSHALQIIATDSRGNVSARSPTTVITVPDRTPLSPPAPPSVRANSNPTMPTLSGSAVAGATVTIYDNDSKLATVTATAGNTWSWTPTAPLSEGTHSFRVTIIDTRRMLSPVSGVTMFTVPDTTRPATPAPPSVSSRSSAQPVLFGATEPGATVHVFSNGISLGSVTAGPTGAWAWKVTPRLSQGTSHDITVTATDTANLTSPASTPMRITVGTTPVVDTTPPNKPPAPIVSTSPTLVILGRSEAGANIQVFDNGRLIKALNTSTEAWTWTVNPAFGLGTHALTVVATDAAGNTSVPSNPTTVTVRDTTPPRQPGAPNVNNGTDDTPILYGTTEPGATVKIYDGATLLHTLTASSVGTWSWRLAPALNAGVHNLSVTATDVARNVSAPSLPRSVTVPDITPPAQPVLLNVTNQNSALPTLSGTAEAGSKVRIYSNDTPTVPASVDADAFGNWSWTPSPGLVQGRHALSVTASDRAGNISARSAPDVIVQVPDSTRPNPPVGLSANDLANATPTLSGTAEPFSRVTIFDGGVERYTVITDWRGNWTWTMAPALLPGAHVITTRATDLANLVSSPSSSITINVPSTEAPGAPLARALGTAPSERDSSLPVVSSDTMVTTPVAPAGDSSPSTATAVSTTSGDGGAGCGAGGSVAMLFGGLLFLERRRRILRHRSSVVDQS